MRARSSEKRKDVQIETTATLKRGKRTGGQCMVTIETKTTSQCDSGKVTVVFKAALGNAVKTDSCFWPATWNIVQYRLVGTK